MSDADLNKVKSLIEEIAPVIFADGKRDDTSGWVAAVENRHVIYNSKIYAPNENISIDRVMNFEVSVCVMSENMPIPDYVDDDWLIAVIPESSSRELSYVDNMDLRHTLGEEPPIDLQDVADRAPQLKN